MNLIFNATLDGLAKGITIGTTLLFVGLIFSEAVFLHPNNLSYIVLSATLLSAI